MSRFRGSFSTAAHQRGELRLAQLSDDNAFVDVEAVLSAATPNSQHSASTSATPRRAVDTTEPFLATEADGRARRASTSTAALASSRVTLSASLLEQHKAYQRDLASVAKTALDVWGKSAEDDEDAADERGGKVDTKSAEEKQSSGNVVGSRRVGAKRGRSGSPSRAPATKRSETVPSEQPKPSLSSAASSPQVTFTPIPAHLLLASWSGRESTAAVPCTDVADRQPAPHTSPLCLCGPTTEDVLQAARRELVILEQWKRWALSPPSASELHRLAQNPTKSDNALLVPSWETVNLPWPVVAHYATSCPSHQALTANAVHRLPFSSAHTGTTASAATTVATSLTESEVRTRELSGWLNLGPPVRDESCDGAQQNHLCSVCLLPAPYRCVRCQMALVCSIECHAVHDATRCLKFMA